MISSPALLSLDALSAQCSVLSAQSGIPAGAMLVPNALRERLARFARVAESAHALSVVGKAARLETGRVAAQLAERLFGVRLDEVEAFRAVSFNRDFSLVWLRSPSRGASAECTLAEQGSSFRKGGGR